MPTDPDPVASADAEVVAGIRAVLTDAATRLSRSGARTEALAEYVPAGRVMLVPRPERLRALGRVWRLGVLLLGVSDGQLYATGSVTRPAEPGRPTFVAASAERRRQLKVAAYRGHFRPGESVNFGARPITVDASLVGSSGPLTVLRGAAFVRWNAWDPAAVTPFDAYLAERIDLLTEPPAGS